jgi:hypothetical protein
MLNMCFFSVKLSRQTEHQLSDNGDAEITKTSEKKSCLQCLICQLRDWEALKNCYLTKKRSDGNLGKKINEEKIVICTEHVISIDKTFLFTMSI